MSLRSLKEALNAPSGAIWTVKQETTIADGDCTVVTLAIEDQNDRPLLMSMIGARPDSFNSELLQGLDLSVEPTAVCQWKKGRVPWARSPSRARVTRPAASTRTRPVAARSGVARTSSARTRWCGTPRTRQSRA